MFKELWNNFLCWTGKHDWRFGNADSNIWGSRLAYDFPRWRICKRKRCNVKHSLNRFLGKWQFEGYFRKT